MPASGSDKPAGSGSGPEASAGLQDLRARLARLEEAKQEQQGASSEFEAVQQRLRRLNAAAGSGGADPEAPRRSASPTGGQLPRKSVSPSAGGGGSIAAMRSSLSELRAKFGRLSGAHQQGR